MAVSITYNYVALTPAGKETKGSLQTENQDKAAALLKQQGLTVVSLGAAGALNKDIELKFLEKKPKPRDLAVFCRQFVSIIDAGVSVISALEMLGEQTENKRLRAALVDCKKSIEKGESLADSMRQHTDVFSGIFITMTEAGEASGSLSTAFTRMAEQFEKSATLQATIKKASIYPIVVLCVALGVVVAMMMFVIPTFQTMFDSMGSDLPALTKGVIAVSQFMVHKWYILLGAVVALVLVIRAFKATPAGQHFFGMCARKLPVIKNLTVKTASASMARTLSTLLAAGIGMTEALEITSRVMTNVFFKEALEQAHEDVSLGNALSESFRRSGVFPPMVYHMVGIGEESGDLDSMLNDLAGYYEEEVQAATAQVMALLEPMIIILLAVIVGTIVISIVSAMASLYSAVDSM